MSFFCVTSITRPSLVMRLGNEARQSGNETRQSGNETRQSGNETRQTGNETRQPGIRLDRLGMRLVNEVFGLCQSGLSHSSLFPAR